MPEWPKSLFLDVHYGFANVDQSKALSESTASKTVVATPVSAVPKFPDGKITKKLNERSCSLTISGKPRKRSQRKTFLHVAHVWLLLMNFYFFRHTRQQVMGVHSAMSQRSKNVPSYCQVRNEMVMRIEWNANS